MKFLKMYLNIHTQKREKKPGDITLKNEACKVYSYQVHHPVEPFLQLCPCFQAHVAELPPPQADVESLVPCGVAFAEPASAVSVGSFVGDVQGVHLYLPPMDQIITYTKQ